VSIPSAKAMPCARDDRGVHADHLPRPIAQRTAGVSGVERGIGLNDVLDESSGARPQAAPERAHHPGGHRAVEAERIADGHHQLPDAKLRRAPERQRREPQVRTDQRGVALRIIAQQHRRALLALDGLHREPRGPMHHVTVGQDQPIGRKGKPRAGAGAASRGVLHPNLHHTRARLPGHA